MSARFVVAAFLAVIVVLFAVYNVEPVTLRFFNWLYPMPLALVITGATVAGALLTGLPALFRQLALTKELQQYEAVKKELETELNNAEAKLVNIEAELAALKATAHEPATPVGGDTPSP